MLTRLQSFFDFLTVEDSFRSVSEDLARSMAKRANGMIHVKDYLALAAILGYQKPHLVFEIGTYLGLTSDFILELVSTSRVVSIAYVNLTLGLFGTKYNNSELSREQVGSLVHRSHRDRFVQIIGDSHVLSAQDLILEYGRFDLVIIDGDHSREGVRSDTEL
jgi:predicted O-methyltransferase YrrM